ncbi:trigger factor [Liquorilactobacillus nagelii]|jgi:trigger factor|uniref:Trigger factor n=2 Tax=Liquorilactobacillus nagelii TaxID=82688 RepID=A0A3Q8D0J7_9LACO|nr:trigger factor [Liquorilactobacillus nagelii]AUJ32303.1 trigger factor [Liquorilactobacillus nagelii]KRL40684.1 trigger factor, PPIase [Liquorilactobacillus nagelii DSM 13675]MCC7615480.1 trigger factor [Liquorilactobacillus nagelii]MCI1699411.1 trigger factor [Liquorilactobacillus nagelii]MCP9314648.1 trigger factor [Liquorilactobacillus nagelii]
MSAKWEKQSENTGKLTFEIAPDKVKEGLDEAFTKVKKNLNVPGFRKGRVPRQIFNRMYGEEALYQDAVNILLPDAYSTAIAETKIKPVDQPKVDVESLEKDKPWVLTAMVTVEPEVEVGEYKNLEVAVQSTEVTDQEVTDELEKKREQQAELVLKEDEPAAKGDTVIIDFDGKLDGKSFEGGKSDNYSLELGSNSFIPGFEDQLVGHKADEDVKVKVTFPEDYQAEDLKGKDAVFDVKIHEVKAKQLPDLDDDFAKDVDEEVETLAELKAKIKEKLQDDKDQAAKDAVQDEAISKAVENAKIGSIPQSMLDEDIDRQTQEYLSGMQQQGINPETYYKLTGSSEADLRKQFEKGSEKRVKTSLVLEAIVAKENVEVSDEEIKQEIDNLAKQYNMEAKAIKKALSDEMLKHDIAIRKVVDEITDSAKQVAKKEDSAK